VFGLDRISQTRGNASHWYGADGQGSVRQLTDNSGNVTDSYLYTAFGEMLNKTGNTENSFTYTGEQWDANAGWYYLRARYMNPSTGTFTSVDPVSGSRYQPISLHRYLYAKASPILYRDPTGNEGSLIEVMADITIIGILALNVQCTFDPSKAPKTVTVNVANFFGATGSAADGVGLWNDKIKKQSNIKAELGNTVNVSESKSKEILGNDLILKGYENANALTSEEMSLFSFNMQEGRVTAYYVKAMEGEDVGEAFTNGTFVVADGSAYTFCHELGHALGLPDGGVPDGTYLMHKFTPNGTNLTPAQKMIMRASPYAK
jgi:RHS repeat-associated protein